MKRQSEAVRVQKSKSIRNGLKIIFMGLFLVFAAGDASAGLPTDQLKASIDKVLNVLNDKTLKAPAMKATAAGSAHEPEY